MFAQVMQARVSDAETLRKQMDVWERDLKEGAHGYMGVTAGVAEDGQFTAVVRFESAEAAEANSNRPEQGEWFAETARCFEGDVTFHNCSHVDLFLGGGSDDAGFVQVIQGTGDRGQLQSVAGEMEDFLRRNRPDLLGGLIAWHDGADGEFTQLAYFRSEAEAREGESRQPEGDDAERMSRLMAVLRDVRYSDLREPILRSA